MTDSEANKAVVRAYVEAMNVGDGERLAALFAPNAQVWGVMGWGGMEVALPAWRDLHEGLALHLTVEGMAAEGSTVAVRYTERGTSRAPFRGRPATGRSYALIAIEWFELDGGRIVRRWGARDGAAQARQLGWE
jgi:predicted ester cyclase